MKEHSKAKETDIYEVYKLTSKIAGGAKQHLSPQVRKADIDKAKQEVRNWSSKAKDNYKNAGSLAMTSYAKAAYRDTTYATVGRKYMRVLALTGANTAAAGRGYLVGLAQASAEK